MDYIIMCGGSYSHMSKPKAMFEINGEKLIERTIRLLNKNGISNKNIIISSNYEAFDNFGVKRISNEKNNWQWVNKKSIGYWLDAFLPYDKKCTYLYGDVYYSEAAIKTIIEKANIVTENTLAGSAIAKNTLGKNWGEPFAFIVPKPLTFHAGIKAVKKPQVMEEGAKAAVKLLSTKGKIAAGVVGLATLGYHWFKASLNVSEKGAAIDHRWGSGHDEVQN